MSGTISYGRSIAGEVTSITNETYQDLPYNPPNLVSNVVNGPNGPMSYALGNGLNVFQSYDQLGRLAGRWVCNGTAAMYCSGGTQVYGTSSVWSGSRMNFQSDTVLNQQLTYGYDEFNRLISRTVSSGTVQNYGYGYDQYGNRISQVGYQGGWSFNPTINPATNQITTSGYSYDAAGNLVNDGAHSYQYDAEGNVLQVDGGTTASYVYDAFNRRIAEQTPSGTHEFTYDYAGRRISGWLSSSNYGDQGRIYWNNQQIAFRAGDGTNFDHQDTLGTERMRTLYDGSVGASYQSLPWGDGYTATVNNSYAGLDSLDFAGLERDVQSTTNPEEDTEHAQFRNYAPAQGRWLSPDRYLGSYDFANPQSLNRYAYVLNNPTSFTDPSGLLNCKFGPCASPAPGCDDGCPPASPPSPSSGDPGCWSCGGTPGGGGGGGGGQPGNQQIYTFSKTVYSTWLQNFDLQLWILTSVPFSSSSGQGVAPNNTQRSCVAGVLGENAVSLGLDALGTLPIPEAGGITRLVGQQLGAAKIGAIYRGVVADQQGANLLNGLRNSTSAVALSGNSGDTSALGLASTAVGGAALTAGYFVPVLGQVLSGGQLIIDAIHTYNTIQTKCYGHS